MVPVVDAAPPFVTAMVYVPFCPTTNVPGVTHREPEVGAGRRW